MNSTLYVPIMLSVLTEENKPILLKQLKEIKADFVFIPIERNFERDDENLVRNMRENLTFFKENGFRAAIWLASIGLNGKLTKKNTALSSRFTRTRGLDDAGEEGVDSFCPLDPEFRKYMMDQVRLCAEAGAEMIMFDDDFCLCYRKGIGCACERHMESFYRRIGERPSRKEIFSKIVSGKPHPWREEWMNCVGDSLREFCRDLRAAADEVNPDIRMGFCSGYTNWDEEGVDAVEVSKLLAGKNRPFMRLSGAPYWHWKERFPGLTLQSVIEFVREQAHWCEGNDIEIFDENDTWPRPRHVIPAAYAEIYDLCMRFSGNVGSFKYLFDYSAPADYEVGYVRAHLADEPIREWIRQNALPQTLGVTVIDEQRKLAKVTLPEAQDYSMFKTEVFRNGHRFLNALSIPVKYAGNDNTCVVFGECARFFKPEDYQKGILLDLPAALILQERGYDLGLVSYRQENPMRERFVSMGTIASGFPMDRGKIYRMEVSEKVKPLSYFIYEDGESVSCYRVECNGVKFAVFGFDGNSARTLECPVYSSYYRQKQVLSLIEEMGGNVPLKCTGWPGLYPLANRDGKSVSVFLANVRPDVVYQPTFLLSERFSRCEVINGKAEVVGNELRFSTDIPAYQCVGIRLYQ